MEDRSSNEDLNAKPNFRLAVIVYIILTNSVKKANNNHAFIKFK